MDSYPNINVHNDSLVIFTDNIMKKKYIKHGRKIVFSRLAHINSMHPVPKANS